MPVPLKDAAKSHSQSPPPQSVEYMAAVIGAMHDVRGFWGSVDKEVKKALRNLDHELYKGVNKYLNNKGGVFSTARAKGYWEALHAGG